MDSNLENKFTKLIKALEESDLSDKAGNIAAVYEYETSHSKLSATDIENLNNLYKLAKANKSQPMTFAEKFKRGKLNEYVGVEFKHKHSGEVYKVTKKITATMANSVGYVVEWDFNSPAKEKNMEYSLGEIKSNFRSKVWVIQN